MSDKEFLEYLASIADGWLDYYSNFSEGDAQRLRDIAASLPEEPQ